MILHSSEEIPETLCSAIQEALKKGLLEKSTQIKENAEYSLLITLILNIFLLGQVTLSGWRQQDTQYS